MTIFVHFWSHTLFIVLIYSTHYKVDPTLWPTQELWGGQLHDIQFATAIKITIHIGRDCGNDQNILLVLVLGLRNYQNNYYKELILRE